MKFSRKYFRPALVSLLLVSILGVCLVGTHLMRLSQAAPGYDLLFSVDYNDAPYSAPASTGVVIRVNNYKANVIYTGKWPLEFKPDPPSLFICEAATGELRQIHLPIKGPFDDMLPGDVAYEQYRGGPAVSINVPELKSLTIDSSSVSPNGYTLFSGIDFNKSYPIYNIGQALPAVTYGDSFRDYFLTLLRSDAYVECLHPIARNQMAGMMTMHFIGWVIPAGNTSVFPRRPTRSN